MWWWKGHFLWEWYWPTLNSAITYLMVRGERGWRWCMITCIGMQRPFPWRVTSVYLKPSNHTSRQCASPDTRLSVTKYDPAKITQLTLLNISRLSLPHEWPFPREIMVMAEDVQLSLSWFHPIRRQSILCVPTHRDKPYRERDRRARPESYFAISIGLYRYLHVESHGVFDCITAVAL